MASFSYDLPQLDGSVFLMDGGLETSLIFLEGVELPFFAAFPLLLDTAGRRRLESYFEPFIRTALEQKVGFVLDTPTWRSNTDWGAKLEYSVEQLVDVNRRAVAWAIDLKGKFASPTTRIVVNGVVGPRGDGYRVDAKMTAGEAHTYHNPQIEAFRDAGAEMVSAITMNYVEEAIGIVKAAQANNIPVVISFTVETDGKLASGDTLEAAIETVERATGAAPAYYMVNCAHPTHFDDVLSGRASWTNRVRGFELMHRRKVTPSLIWRPNSTQATRKNSVNNTTNCVSACPSYRFLADAAGLIIDTSSQSAMHVTHEGDGHFRYWQILLQKSKIYRPRKFRES